MERVLHHERMVAPEAAPRRWLYLLHGIYGTGRNWASLMRRVIRERPDWGAELVDLREHGSSQGFPPPHTLAAVAGDVAELVQHLATPSNAVLGHSFGGKIALMYARQGGAVGQLWIIDSTPEARSPDGSAVRMLDALRRHPGPFLSRDAGVRALEGEGVETPVAQWMATNLALVEGEYRWRLDFDAMDEMLQDFFRTDLWDVVESPPAGVEIHFVKADRSNVLSEAACERIEAAARSTGRVFLHHMAGGHWLNVDNPDALVQLLAARL